MTENTPAVYAQNYRAAQYDGKVAEKRRREALIALQEAQRRGEGREITARLTEYSAAVQAGLKALAAIHAAFVAGVTARVGRICNKCGEVKTLNARGQYRCRPCSRVIAAHGCAAAAAARIARRAPVIAPETEIVPEVVPALREAATNAGGRPREKSAIEVFDTVCETHGLGASVPRMHPNAGRLKAGQSLYPRREATA